MKRVLFVAVLSVAWACHDSPAGPGQVTAVTAMPPGVTGSPLSNIAGDWKGSVAYSYEDDWCACCVPGRQASATFTQDGSRVSGTIHTNCFDEQVTGTLQAGKVTGTASVATDAIHYQGATSGQATTTGLRLVTGNLLQGDGHSVSGYTVSLSR